MKLFKGFCQTCKTEVKCFEKEGVYNRSNPLNVFFQIKCPKCNNFIMAQRENKNSKT